MEYFAILLNLVHTTERDGTIRQTPFKNEDRNYSMKELIMKGFKSDINISLTPSHEYSAGIIKKAFTLNKDREWIIKENIRPKIIYNRLSTEEFEKISADINTKDIKIVNNLELCKLMKDKYETYKTFTENAIETIQIKQGTSIEEVLRLEFDNNSKDYNTDIKVMKPRYGMKSNGVFLANNYDIQEIIGQSRYIAQPFFKSINMLKNKHSNNPSELRILMSNGKIISSCIYNSSTDLNYFPFIIKKEYFSPEKISQKIKDVAYSIDDKLEDFGNRIYSIDLGVSKNGNIRLFELNNSPGMLEIDYNSDMKEYYENYYDGIIDLFKQI